MSRLLTQVSTFLIALIVLGGLTFGATQAFGSSIVSSCTEPGEIGTCPPFDNNSCSAACIVEFGNPGFCDQSDCCQCLI